MAKFFNKIRKQLVSEKPSVSRTSNYLKYAIGEIVLVVIGILIALQINNWNENKKLYKTTQIYYQQLLKDLSSDKTYISEKIAMYNDRTSRYNAYKEIFKKPNLSPQEVNSI